MSYGNTMSYGAFGYTPNPYETYEPKEDRDEIRECRICGEKFLPDELFDTDVCQSCIDEYSTLANLRAAGNVNKEYVEVNGFFATAFTEEEINDILEQKFTDKLLFDKENAEKIISEYVDNDPDGFARILHNDKSL